MLCKLFLDFVWLVYGHGLVMLLLYSPTESNQTLEIYLCF